MGGGILTNPRLSKFITSQNLILFDDVISPYATTNSVMQTLLNFSNYENTTANTPWYSFLDIVGLFKLGGYKTYFISNQEGFGIWGNAAASIGRGADVYYFANGYKDSHTAKPRPDGVLLEYLNSLHFDDKNFIIIHLMGSHYAYKLRYDNDFDVFNANDIKRDDLSLKKRKKIAQYYNSVLYNDYILEQIFNKFKNDDSILIYLSDHGESLYDDKTGKVMGHSIVDKTNAQIPFLVFTSDIFKTNHNDIFQALEKSKHRPYMSDDLIHTFCDIAGILVEECDESKSVINSNFNQYRKRIFQGVDYDEKLKK